MAAILLSSPTCCFSREASFISQQYIRVLYVSKGFLLRTYRFKSKLTSLNTVIERRSPLLQEISGFKIHL